MKRQAKNPHCLWQLFASTVCVRRERMGVNNSISLNKVEEEGAGNGPDRKCERKNNRREKKRRQGMR